MRLDIKRISRILFFIYIAAVGALCLIRTDSLPELPASWLGIPADKIAHFCMFVPFPVLSCMSIIGRKTGIWLSVAVIIVLAAMGSAFAYGTELLQGQTGYRSYDIADFYADLAGLAAGAVISVVYIIISRRK